MTSMSVKTSTVFRRFSFCRRNASLCSDAVVCFPVECVVCFVACLSVPSAGVSGALCHTPALWSLEGNTARFRLEGGFIGFGEIAFLSFLGVKGDIFYSK